MGSEMCIRDRTESDIRLNVVSSLDTQSPTVVQSNVPNNNDDNLIVTTDDQVNDKVELDP